MQGMLLDARIPMNDLTINPVRHYLFVFPADLNLHCFLWTEVSDVARFYQSSLMFTPITSINDTQAPLVIGLMMLRYSLLLLAAFPTSTTTSHGSLPPLGFFHV